MNDTLKRAQELGAPFNCQICGEIENLTYTEERQRQLAHHRICFSCNFWVERFWFHLTDPQSVICNREAYMARDTPLERRFRGYGGRKFTFYMLDGRTIVSTDVWHQGEVPEHFSHLLPDNAIMGDW
jgi:hypothetical protein